MRGGNVWLAIKRRKLIYAAHLLNVLYSAQVLKHQEWEQMKTYPHSPAEVGLRILKPP